MPNETQISDGAREVAHAEIANENQCEAFDIAATDMNGQPRGHFVHAYAEQQTKELREQLTRWREDAERLANCLVGWHKQNDCETPQCDIDALTAHTALINETNKP